MLALPAMRVMAAACKNGSDEQRTKVCGRPKTLKGASDFAIHDSLLQNWSANKKTLGHVAKVKRGAAIAAHKHKCGKTYLNAILEAADNTKK